jgi:hypothetical protein
VRIGSGNLARFKPLVLSVVNVPKNVSALLSTGTVQGYRTAASVSKAVTNQHNLSASEDMISFGMDSFPENDSAFKAPSVVQRTDVVIIQICF